MILSALIAIYRANPLRPHCHAAVEQHTFLCSLFGFNAASRGVYEGNTRCPWKDA